VRKHEEYNVIFTGEAQDLIPFHIRDDVVQQIVNDVHLSDGLKGGVVEMVNGNVISVSVLSRNRVLISALGERVSEEEIEKIG
jgi:hypothetical protein